MAKHIISMVAGGVMALVVTNAIAEPDMVNGLYPTTVIEDRGGVPIKNYIGNGTGSRDRIKELREERKKTRLTKAQFPVKTPEMTIGPVSANEAKSVRYQWLTQPLFIIGYDPVSIKWLKQNKQRLEEQRAIGLVVNVSTPEQMNELQAIAGSKVRMQPTPGTDMSKNLNIGHYPFYADGNGVMR